MAIVISKSKYLAGVQCLKRLYLLVNEPRLGTGKTSADLALMEQGRQVGRLAHQLFPGGVLVRAGDPQEAIRVTRELIGNPDVTAIFEAAFEHDGVFVRVDILQRRKENRWRLVEVKSSSDLKEHHLEDMAIQSHVLSHSGLDLASIWLAHINRKYVLAEEAFDPRQFFLFRNLTRRVQNLQPALTFQLRSQFRVLAMSKAPDLPTGQHCINPVTCEFFDHCNRPKPNDHIGYIPRLHGSAMQQLEEMGAESIHDIPDDFELSEFQRRVCDAMQMGQPWFSAELKGEFDSLKYPLYFMDFETVNPAIPRFVNMHPYDHIPFQFSVHVQQEPGAVPNHSEFLAMDNGDPRPAFISSLCEALGERGSIVVYNEQFESQRLWELAGWLPEYTQRIRDIQSRLWDLLPVVRNHVYHPAFGGSFSLKAVLPALVPEMTYEGMEVPNGQAAGLAWEEMISGRGGEAERQERRQALLEYCGQDTMALVKLVQTLTKL